MEKLPDARVTLASIPAPKRQRCEEQATGGAPEEEDESLAPELPPQSSGLPNIFASLQRRSLGLGAAIRNSASWYASRLQIDQELEQHDGCVNCVAWSRDGKLLASGSDDTRVCIWSYGRRTSLRCCLNTGHAANIFGVAFLANEPLVSSCSIDGTVRLMDIAAERCASIWRAHHRGANKVVTTADEPNIVTSCGADGKVRQHDRRVRRPDLLLDWDLRWDGCSPGVASSEINSMATAALKPDLLALGGDDPFLWLYDRRTLGATRCEPMALFGPPGLAMAPSISITGVALSPDGRRVLGSWQRADAFEFATCEGRARPPLCQLLGQKPGRRHGWDSEPQEDACCAPLAKFSGHSNIRTIKEVSYLGTEASLVASGSDCGHLFIWDAKSGRLLNVRRGDLYVVNAIASHPREPSLATSGIDSSVKLWMPLAKAEPSCLSDAGPAWVSEIIRANQQRRYNVDSEAAVMDGMLDGVLVPHFEDEDDFSPASDFGSDAYGSDDSDSED